MKLIHFFLASVFIFNVQTLHAQSCAEPTNVILMVPFGGGSSDFPTLLWDYNEDCSLMYFEIEYGYGPFTPGMGEGILISPVPSNPPYYTLDSETTAAWIRAICSPECNGENSSTDWVPAQVDITAPTEFPEGSFCETAPDKTVLTYQECAYQGVTYYPDFIFYDGFNEWAQPVSEDVPCSEEGVFAIYRKFTATEAGIVEISVEENEMDDYGLIVYDGPCQDGEILECTESFTNPHTVENLIPGEEYYVGFWQNGYTPYFYYESDGIDYNMFSPTIKICEAGCGDFSLTAGPDTSVGCGDMLPEPDYTVTGGWCTGYDVAMETTLETVCGGTISRTYTATDSLGNTASDTQLYVITDIEAPTVVSAPDDLTISCDEEWSTDSPEFSDNCSIDLEITFTQDTITDNGCEIIVEEIWFATDNCENTTEVVRTITIQDETPPELNCPDDMMVYISNEDEMYVLSNLAFELESSDNCAENVTISQSIEAGTELGAGEHTITLAASDGCNSTSCEVTVEVLISTSVKNEEANQFVLYPNPADGMINVQRKDSSPLQVEVFDVSGKLVFSEQFNTQHFNLDLRHSATGIYSVHLKSATHFAVEQIVIK